MSQENVDAFRRGTDAVNRGDVEAVLQLADTELVFDPLRTATEGTYIGREGMRHFLADTAETFELFELNYTDVRDLGDRVLGIGSVWVRGRGSGLETQFPSGVIACYRDGLCWRYKDYGEAALALEAAGLRA
jgi:ketosteroid isomerase-like protein